MRIITHVGALTVALALSPLTMAQTPPPAPAKTDVPAPKPKYDEDTPYGVLMRDPAAKNVLIADWPLLVTAIEMGGVPETSTMRGALTSESARSQGGLTDALYEKIIADLKKL
jgi:hypothetical protein